MRPKSATAAHAIVYLARGVGTGLSAAREFFTSYQAYPAGLAHELVVLAKGWVNADDRRELDVLAARHGGTIIDLPDNGYDWGAYTRAAQMLSHEKLCFLNTHSRIQSNGWLAKLSSALDVRGVGAAGATGSWGTMCPTFKFIAPSVSDIAGSRGLARASYSAVHGYCLFPLRWMMASVRFPPFPNAHLRSNAFLMRRQLFLEFSARSKLPRSKFDAFALESGWRGLSRFIYAKGLRPVVVTANARVYESSEWDECGVFRCPGQPSLLISDNQTRAYDTAPAHVRRIMERSAWGRTFTPRQASSRSFADAVT